VFQLFGVIALFFTLLEIVFARRETWKRGNVPAVLIIALLLVR